MSPILADDQELAHAVESLGAELRSAAFLKTKPTITSVFEGGQNNIRLFAELNGVF